MSRKTDSDSKGASWIITDGYTKDIHRRGDYARVPATVAKRELRVRVTQWGLCTCVALVVTIFLSVQAFAREEPAGRSRGR